MRVLRPVTLLIVLAMLLVIVPMASASGPAGNWVSGIACQNLSDTNQAVISLSFYPENNGTSVLDYTDPTPIDKGGSRNYFTPSSPAGLPSPFVGSAVVSSDQQLACNVNTQTTGTGTAASPYRIGTSAGVAAGDTAPKLYVPQVMKAFAGTWGSYIAVQNTDASAAAVTVTYKDRTGADQPAATEHFTIPPQSNKIFYQSDNANLPANFLGSAIVSADNTTSKLAAVVNLYNAGTSNTDAQFLSYNAVPTGSAKLLVPRVVRAYHGYNSGLSIQNVGGADTTVKITFNFAGNSYVYNSPVIHAGAALPLYAPDIAELGPVNGLAESQRFGSAVIEAAAGGTVVAIVNEDNRGGTGIPVEAVGQGSTYNALLSTAATQTIFFPQVTRLASSIFSGGFQVADASGAGGTCNISWAGASAANEANVTLPAGGAISRYAPTVANVPNGFNSSVTVSCSVAVVGISNLAAAPGTGRLGDSFAQTTGINR